MMKSSDTNDVDVCDVPSCQIDIKRTISEELSIEDIYDLDVYSVPHFENLLRLKPLAIKYEESDSDKSDSSVSSDDYEVAAKKKKNKEPKIDIHLKQTAIEYTKYTTDKHKSSDKLEMSSSSDSSDVLSSLDSSVEWEKPSSVSSDESETPSSDSSEELSTSDSDELGTPDSSDYAEKKRRKKTRQKDKKKKYKKKKYKKKKYKKKKDKKNEELTEYEKMILKNKEEKLAFLRSLKMDEIKDDFNEAIRNLKTKRAPQKSKIKRSKAEMPIRKSIRSTKVDINYSEDALEERSQREAETEIEKPRRAMHRFRQRRATPDRKKKEPSVKEDSDEAILNLEHKRPPRKCKMKSGIPGKSIQSTKVDSDLSENALEARTLGAAGKESEKVKEDSDEAILNLEHKRPPRKCKMKSGMPGKSIESTKVDSDLSENGLEAGTLGVAGKEIEKVEEDSNEAILNLKRKRPPRKSKMKSSEVSTEGILISEMPIRKSIRSTKVDIDLSEEALEVKMLGEDGKEIEKNDINLKQRAVKDKKYTSDENDLSDGCEVLSSVSSNDCKILSSDSYDDCKPNVKKKKIEKPVGKIKKVDKKPQINELSEFERIIQKKREARLAILQSVSVDESL